MITRAKAVIDALLNKDTPNAQLLRIVDAFVGHFQHEIQNENPTNEEKAGFFLLKMKEYGREIVYSQANRTARSQYQSDIQDVINNALTDME